jgi:hypothetical protein
MLGSDTAVTFEPEVDLPTEPPITTPAWPGSPADAVFLAWSPLEEDALLFSYEFFALGNGTIDLLVQHPLQH